MIHIFLLYRIPLCVWVDHYDTYVFEELQHVPSRRVLSHNFHINYPHFLFQQKCVSSSSDSPQTVVISFVGVNMLCLFEQKCTFDKLIQASVQYKEVDVHF